MEIKFKAICQYTLQDIILLKKLGSKYFNTSLQLLLFLLYVMPSILLFFIDGYFSFKGNFQIGVFAIIIIYILPYIIAPIQVYVTKNKPLKNFTVTFYQDHFIIEDSKKREFEYRKSIKVNIKQNKVYLRPARSTYLLIKKEEFVIGSAESFIEFLRITTKDS